MINVKDAKQKIVDNSSALSTEIRSIETAVGFVLASDVLAPLSLPSFRQSSMDGYAIRHTDVTKSDTSLKVVSESKAGELSVQTLTEGNAIRIFTGAPVPEGASAVIMQEHTSKEDDAVIIHEYPVKEGKNIRSVGQQIKEGEIALPKGTYLSPGSIGFLLGMNIENVIVYKKPKIGLLVTGDELVKKGQPLARGQVYESNSAMLTAALQAEGISEIEIKYASDDLNSTIEALEELSDANDVILTSGGVSVGDYDFVGKALEAIQAETIFYKIKQKPGKPLLFAKRVEKLFFALPGNPASSLVCYYEYVLPAIRIMYGRSDFFLRSMQMPIRNSYSFDGERDEFLKAVVNADGVISLDGQESFALRSFAIANAIIYLPVYQNEVEPDDLVEVHFLPG